MEKWCSSPTYLCGNNRMDARKLKFYLLVHGFSFDIMQHLGLCSVSDTSIWKGSISSQQQCECNISFPSSEGEGHGSEASALFHVVRSLPPLLIDNHWHLIWRRSNTQSIFVPPIRRTICCCPACRSLNVISFSRNKVLIVHIVCEVTVSRE